MIAIICLLCAAILLTQCNKDDASGTDENTAKTVESSTSASATAVSDSATPLAGTQSDGQTSETSLPTETPEPTSTPTEGEMAAEAAAQQFVPEYFSNKDECLKAVAEGTVTECMYASSIQNITRPEWEQLFPDAEFHLIRLEAYHPEDVYDSFSARYRLVAWQNGQKYEAESFDQLLKVNNTIVNDETRELIAKAFALMTLPGEYHHHEIVFTNWETIDIQGVFHYNYSLQAWTELGGVEVTWAFVFNGERLQAASGGFVMNVSVGDYIDFVEFGANITLKDYRFDGG